MIVALQTQNCILSVSTNIFQDKIELLEDTEKPMRLFLKITKMKNVRFLQDEVKVPLSHKELQSLRIEAESARKHLIPIISKI